MIFAIAAGILLAFYILRMLRLVPLILAILVILYLIGSVMQAHAQAIQPPIQWQPISQWFINPGQVRLYRDNMIYAMVQVPPAGQIGPQTPRTWNFVDLTRAPFSVSNTAKVASVFCDLIITGAPINNATNTASADPVGGDGWFPHVHLTFRAHGDTNADPTGYAGDVESSLRGDGIRTNVSVLVPLYQGKYDWLADFDDTLPPWDGTNAGGPAYGVNCSLQAFGQ